MWALSQKWVYSFFRPIDGTSIQNMIENILKSSFFSENQIPTSWFILPNVLFALLFVFMQTFQLTVPTKLPTWKTILTKTHNLKKEKNIETIFHEFPLKSTAFLLTQSHVKSFPFHFPKIYLFLDDIYCALSNCHVETFFLL